MRDILNEDFIYTHRGENIMSEHNDQEHGNNLKHIHIFVNRKKFDLDEGVHALTGAQIAAFVDIPADKAVVKYDSGSHKGEEIPVTETVDVNQADHFVATRSSVDGGYDS